MIWAVQMATVEFHPWNSRRADVEQPDEWRIDLDPMPAASFDAVRRVAAGGTRGAREMGAVGWPKTSGGNGMHIYVRISPGAALARSAEAALAFAREVERRDPRRGDYRRGGAGARPPKVFVDYNQNARDHTIACAYSVRGVPSERVSTPIGGDELEDVEPGELTIATVPARFAGLGDLHAGIDEAVFARAAARVGGSRRGLGAASRHPWDRAHPVRTGWMAPWTPPEAAPTRAGWCTISTSQCAWCATASLTLCSE